MSTSPIRVGIIGSGNISDTHARAARAVPGVEIVAVYGRQLAKASRLAELYGGQAYDDLERFLDHRPMEMVAIGSPSARHADDGIAAAQRGLHVLVEKPLDVNAARADALIAATDRAGVKLGVFFQDRLKPDVVKTKALIDAGTLGKPLIASGRVKWLRPPEYYRGVPQHGAKALAGGGALINQAIHTLDLLLYVVGDIARVQTRAANLLHDIEVEDTVVATLEFANGALGSFEASTAVFPGYARRVEITGTSGTLVIEHDQIAAVDLLPGARNGIELATPPSATSAFNAASPLVADATPHQRIVEDFVAAIRADRRPICDGAEGRRSVAVIDAMYESARSGQAAEVERKR